jgi:hypothetical protein
MRRDSHASASSLQARALWLPHRWRHPRSPRGRISEITKMQTADTAMSTTDSW